MRLLVFCLPRMVGWPMSVPYQYHQPWYLNKQKILSVWLWLWLDTKVWMYRKKWPGSDHVFLSQQERYDLHVNPEYFSLALSHEWSEVKRCKVNYGKLLCLIVMMRLWHLAEHYLSSSPPPSSFHPLPLKLLKVHQPCAGDLSQGSQTVPSASLIKKVTS